MQELKEKIKKYTVCFIFNKDGSKILLQVKDKTTFTGKLNGVGGKLEPSETILECAYREIEEETSIHKSKLKEFKWIGTLTIPENCDTNYSEYIPELSFYAGILDDESRAIKPLTESEEIY